MNQVKFHQVIENTNPKLYSVAFAITGQKELAQELVLDSLIRVSEVEKQFLEEYQLVSSSEEFFDYQHEFLVHCLCGLFEIAKVKDYTPSEVSDFEGFWSLKQIERVLLYLKEVLNFDIDDLEKVFNKDPHEVRNLLCVAKENLSNASKYFGQENNLPDIPLEALKKGKCPHERIVVAAAHNAGVGEESEFLKRHISECENCRITYMKEKEGLNESIRYLPKFQVPREVQMNVEKKSKELSGQFFKAARTSWERKRDEYGGFALKSVLDLGKSFNLKKVGLYVALFLVIFYLMKNIIQLAKI